MKAVAVVAGKPDSEHLVDLAVPRVEDIPDGQGVLVKVLRVGLDGTDREISAGEYGLAPLGQDFLILGHESIGVVEQVGPRVTEPKPGDLVVATVRRPGKSLYDAIGMPDMTTDDTYYERGISLLHGFLSEYYLETPEFLVRLSPSLREVGVLLEPMSVVEKGVAQAFEIQRRMGVWQPRRAAVLGAGTIGLLATMALRLLGLDVVTLALDDPPSLNSELVEASGARYSSTRVMSVAKASENYGPFDLIFEATGFSPITFEAMEVLGKNGVLVLSSVTGGSRKLEVPSDAINLGFVLGNKVMVGTVSSGRDHYAAGVRDMALAESLHPGWLARLLTDPIGGLASYRQGFERLRSKSGSIKVFFEVAPS